MNNNINLLYKLHTQDEIIGFQEEIANNQTAITDFESGHNLNVAIISEPYAGRTAFMNEIEKMNPPKVTKFSFHEPKLLS